MAHSSVPCFLGINHDSLQLLLEGQTITIEDLAISCISTPEQFAEAQASTDPQRLYLQRSAVVATLDFSSTTYKLPFMWTETQYGRVFTLASTSENVLDPDYDPANE